MTTNIINKIYKVVSPNGSTEIDLSKLTKINTDHAYHYRHFYYICYIYDTGKSNRKKFYNGDDRDREFDKLANVWKKYQKQEHSIKKENKDKIKSKYLSIKKVISEISNLTSQSPKVYVIDYSSNDYTLDNIYDELIDIKNKLEEKL